MSWLTAKIGDFLKRSKLPVDIEDSKKYRRVTIRGKHQGVTLRDIEWGQHIGTKKQFSLRAGQFVLSKIDARYGAFGIAPHEVDGAIITGNFWAYDVDEEKVNIEWFNQYTNSPGFYDVCERASSGITHRKYLDENFFLNYDIGLPSIDEQESMIGIINNQKGSIRNTLTELNRQLALVKELRQAYLREAMQGKLSRRYSTDEPAGTLLERIRADKEKLVAEGEIRRQRPLAPIKPGEIPFDIPSNWTWCRLGDIVSTIFDGPFGSHLKTADYTEQGIQVIRLENISFLKFNLEKETFISEEKYKTISQHTVYEGDILVSSFIADGVKTTLIPTLKHTAIAKADCFTVRTFDNWAVKKFIVYALSSELIFEEFLQYSHGMTRLRVNTSQLKNVMFPFPPLAEQERIVAKLGKLMKHCDELETNISQGISNADRLLQTALKEALEPK